MNLPYSVVAARIPWHPTPHRPSRSQATVAVADAKTVSFPKEANNVHTQGSSQLPIPYLSLIHHPALQKIHLKLAKNGKGLQLISHSVT